MRRLWSDFWTAFWRACELERQKRELELAFAQPVVSMRPGPGVEPPAEPPRLVAPSPVTWPDEHEWVNVLVDCPCCGDSVIQVTSAWLVAHAGVGSLVCPFCQVPTDQAITYDISA